MKLISELEFFDGPSDSRMIYERLGIFILKYNFIILVMDYLIFLQLSKMFLRQFVERWENPWEIIDNDYLTIPYRFDDGHFTDQQKVK